MNPPVAVSDFLDSFSDLWCRYRHDFYPFFCSLMNLPVALFNFFSGFSDFRCRYRQHFLPVFGSLRNLPVALFHPFRLYDEPTSSTFRPFWWAFRFCYADTDSTFSPIFNDLMNLPVAFFDFLMGFWDFWCRYRHHFLPVVGQSDEPISSTFQPFSTIWWTYQ